MRIFPSCRVLESSELEERFKGSIPKLEKSAGSAAA
jgi:hypothetical protein